MNTSQSEVERTALQKVYETDPRLAHLRLADSWMSALNIKMEDNRALYSLLASLAAHAKRASDETTAAETAKRSLKVTYELLQSTIAAPLIDMLRKDSAFLQAISSVERQ